MDDDGGPVARRLCRELGQRRSFHPISFRCLGLQQVELGQLDCDVLHDGSYCNSGIGEHPASCSGGRGNTANRSKYGKLSDIFGRKPLLLVAYSCTLIGSIIG